MQLFCCDRCKHVDAVEIAYPDAPPQPVGNRAPEWVCTQCQEGEWHGLFEYRPYDQETDIVINRPSGVGLGL